MFIEIIKFDRICFNLEGLKIYNILENFIVEKELIVYLTKFFFFWIFRLSCF